MKDIDILKHLSLYNSEGEKVDFFYQKQNDDSLMKIHNSFYLKFYAGSDLEIALILMNHIFKTLIPGNRDYPSYSRNCNTLDILDATREYAIQSNCLMYSVVLAETLLSFGIKARVVICRPYNFIENTDCHCVVHAFIKHINKWILLDPANNTTYRDDSGSFLSIAELRSKLINEESIKIFGFNKNKYASITTLKNYLSKYFVIFFCLKYNGFNCFSDTSNNISNILLPVKYNESSLNDIEKNDMNFTFCDVEFWKS